MATLVRPDGAEHGSRRFRATISLEVEKGMGAEGQWRLC